MATAATVTMPTAHHVADRIAASKSFAARCRNGRVRTTYDAATRPTGTSAGTTVRKRAGLTAKNTTPPQATATRPPLLCVISHPASIAAAPAPAAARNDGLVARSDASAIAGQKPIRNSAACAFTYEIGKVKRPFS